VKKILILGGTAEARELADALVAQGHAVTTSLAGRTSDPILPKGELRVGKFGGVPGLQAYLKAHGIERLVDATHPYAALMSTNAVAAAGLTGVPLVRYVRPGWREPDGAGWVHVPDIPAAAAALPAGATVLVTTGHEGLDAFFRRNDCEILVRLIDRPEGPLPAHMELLLARPPYRLEDELALLRRQEITHLVTKNSGGEQTRAKLEAAAQLGVATIMVARPPLPAAVEADTLAGVLAALHLEDSA